MTDWLTQLLTTSNQEMLAHLIIWKTLRCASCKKISMTDWLTQLLTTWNQEMLAHLKSKKNPHQGRFWIAYNSIFRRIAKPGCRKPMVQKHQWKSFHQIFSEKNSDLNLVTPSRMNSFIQIWFKLEQYELAASGKLNWSLMRAVQPCPGYGRFLLISAFHGPLAE